MKGTNSVVASMSPYAQISIDIELSLKTNLYCSANHCFNFPQLCDFGVNFHFVPDVNFERRKKEKASGREGREGEARMDYAQEQADEIEALQSIYTG
eukprot:2788288-Rhodomonas_salina.2